MEAILENNPTTLVITGNDGNPGNNAPKSSNSKALTVVGVYPNSISDIGNQWEQNGLAVIGPIPDHFPAIPDKYKVLKIDGETRTVSGEWIYRDSQGKFL